MKKESSWGGGGLADIGSSNEHTHTNVSSLFYHGAN
jgi:hypothetical protein